MVCMLDLHKSCYLHVYLLGKGRGGGGGGGVNFPEPSSLKGR